MSYAEQFFGIKENKAIQYVDNLAWFGKDSYVYKNADMMNEVLGSAVALQNSVGALYAYLWVRERGYDASIYFNKGFVVSIYNSALNKATEYVLYQFNADGSANFVSKRALLAMPFSTTGLAFDHKDYEIVQFLNGEKNWFDRWENKPDGIIQNGTMTMWEAPSVLVGIRRHEGFLAGFFGDVRDALLSFKGDDKSYVLPLELCDLDSTSYIVTNRNDVELSKVSKETWRKSKELALSVNPNVDTSIVDDAAEEYWSAIMHDITLDEFNALGEEEKAYRGHYHNNKGIINVYGIDNTTVFGAKITGFSAITVKIRM